MKRNRVKCGERCGESAVLSTKSGHSLPLRHSNQRHFCLSTEVPFFFDFICISHRKASSAIKQASSVISQVRNLIKARFGGKLVVKTAGAYMPFFVFRSSL